MSESDGALGNVVHGVERAQPQRALAPVNRALRVAAVRHQRGPQGIHQRTGRAQRQGSLERLTRQPAVMRHYADGKARKCERHRVARTVLDRRMGMAD